MALNAAENKRIDFTRPFSLIIDGMNKNKLKVEWDWFEWWGAGRQLHNHSSRN